jgi:hypothetical protein
MLGQQCIGYKVLAGMFWQEYFGGNILVGMCKWEYFGRNALAAKHLLIGNNIYL